MKTLNLQQTADLLNVSYRTANELAMEGELPGCKVGTAWVFIESDVLDWLRDKINHDKAQRQTIALGDMTPAQFVPAIPPRRTRRGAIPDLPSLESVGA